MEALGRVKGVCVVASIVVAEGLPGCPNARKKVLLEIEGKDGFEEQQKFLATAATIAKENRLSRFAYLSERNL